MLEQVPVELGSWSFKVLQSMALRKHPNRHGLQHSKIYVAGERVLCDCKVQSNSNGNGGEQQVNFYRVMKTDGWLFDVAPNGQTALSATKMLELYWTGPTQHELDSISAKEGLAWSPDFVRGVAACSNSSSNSTIGEILFDQANKLLSFRTDQGFRINVYYTTRTIGTAVNHPVHGTTQLFRRDCTPQQLSDILCNPRAHAGQAYNKRKCWDENPAILQSSQGPGIVVQEEEILRVALQECDAEMVKLRAKRMELLKSVKLFDDVRTAQARRALQKYADQLEK